MTTSGSESLDVVRTGPPNVPIAGFFERALEADEVRGEAEVDEVLRALGDGRAMVRRNAAMWLGAAEAARATSEMARAVVAALVPLGRDPEVGVRLEVARALGAIGGDEAVAALVQALADGAAEVREQAVQALVAQGVEVLGAMLGAVRASDPQVVERVAAGVRQVVARHGASAVQGLADALRGERELGSRAREMACKALSDLGQAAEDAVPSLLLLLKDPADEVRAAAASALGYIGVDDAIVLDDLKALLRDKVFPVRRQAALAAARLQGRPLDDRRPAEPRVVPIEGFEAEVLGHEAMRERVAASGGGAALVGALVHALNDGREIVRGNAARALGVLGEGGASGLEVAARPLAMVLRDAELGVRRAAAEALSALGAQAEPATWYLTGALGEPDEVVREAVIAALLGLFPESEAFLIEALRCDPDAAEAGIFVVWRRLEGRGVPGLVKALEDASGLIRANAARALERMARLGAAEALGALRARLADPLGMVRAAAQAAIDEIEGGRPRPVTALEPDLIAIDGFYDARVDDEVLAGQVAAARLEQLARHLRDGRANVRANAASLLMHQSDADALAPVLPGLQVLARDEAHEVRKTALSALGALIDRGAAPLEPYAESLVWGLRERVTLVRNAAREALARLGERALPALIAGLEGADDKLVAEIGARFLALGPGAIDALAAALSPASPELHAGALTVLRGFEREVLPAELRAKALSLATAEERAVRAAAAQLIARIDGRDQIPVALEPVVVPIAGFDEVVLPREELAAGAAAGGVALFAGLLRDGRKVVRLNAANALGALGMAGAEGLEQAARPLALLLRDADRDVRLAAIGALASLGKHALSAASFMGGALSERDAEVREAAIAALVALQPEAEDALIEALRVDSDVAAEGVALVWYRLAGAGVPGLEKALAHGSALVRLNAARTLELMARNGAATALGALTERLADPVRQVAAAAHSAIETIQGTRPRPVVVLEPDPIDIPGFSEGLVEDEVLAAHKHVAGPERLTRQLRDGRAFVRANAALLLRHHADASEVVSALPTLAVLARDEAVEVRARAIRALGSLVESGAAPVETYADVLVRALGDRAPTVREAAATALGELGEKAFPALALGLADERALEALAPIFLRLGEGALTALPDALSPLTPELHLGALTVLHKFPREGLAPSRALVSALLGSHDPAVRGAAVRVLDRIDGKDLEPAAAEPLPLPLPGFADALIATETLADAASELRFDLLQRAMNDGREIVRANAAAAMGVLGSAHELAWPLLVRALKDPTVEVRLRAVEALGAIPPRRDVAFDLVKRLDDRSPRVIAAAEKALASYGEFAIDAYLFALDDRPELVGHAILPMLASLGEHALDKLVIALRYDSPFVRLNALLALRLLDKELAQRARVAVAEARKDEDREVRLEALRTLDWLDGIEHVLLREPRTLPTEDFADEIVPVERLEAAARAYDEGALGELLFDGRRVVRENAARAHGLIGRFHPWLPLLLKDSVGAVQVAAAEALVQLGDLALPSARALTAALLEDEAAVREAAREALLAFGTKALPVLVDGLWAPPDVARKTVVPFIEALGKEATPTIIEALDHPSQLVVLNALQVLGRLYSTDPKGALEGMPKVVALVKNPLPAIIGAAQKCLFRLEGRTPAEFQKDPVPMPILGFDKGPLAVDTLRAEAPALDVEWMISAFSDGRPIVRENAARAAGFMPNALPHLLGPLTVALKDGIPEVQVAAADAFATLHAADEVAIPALTFALRNATERVKRACMVALDAYGPKRVADELVKHLVGREDWMLVTIAKVVSRMSEVLVPALASFAKRSDESLIARENAVRVIADLGQKARAAEPILLELLPEMEGMLACKAAFALGAVARPSQELIEAMQAHLQVDPRPSLHKEIRQAVKILKRRMPVGTGASAAA